MFVIVDYGMGNLKSVKNAIEFLGFLSKISDSPQVIKKAKKIIFPGVGHFGKAVRELKKRRIFHLLIELIKEKVPFFGICLGMQLLFGESQEAPGVRGLDILCGKVKRFHFKNLIVPHMGWNSIKIQEPCKNKLQNMLFKDIKDNSYFYFAHSYYCTSEENIILSTTYYGIEFISSLYKENIWAVQFHPEKSQDIGLKVLNNFLTLC